MRPAAPDTAPAPAQEPVSITVLRSLLRPVARATNAAVARIENPEALTLLELQRMRRKDEYRRERDAERERRESARVEAHAEKIRAAEAARRAQARAREERIEAAEREKHSRKDAREQEKRRRGRAKRRAAMLTQVKRRLGWKRAP